MKQDSNMSTHLNAQYVSILCSERGVYKHSVLETSVPCARVARVSQTPVLTRGIEKPPATKRVVPTGRFDQPL